MEIHLRLIETLTHGRHWFGASSKTRVALAAERALIDRPFVTAIDVLVGIGWLTTSQVDGWRQGRVDYLERQVTPTPRRSRSPWPPSAIGLGKRVEPPRLTSRDPGITDHWLDLVLTIWLSSHHSRNGSARNAPTRSIYC